MVVRRRTLILGALAGLVLVAIALVAPLLFTPERVKAFFLREVETQVGRHIEVGEIRFHLLPSIKLSLTDVLIRDEHPLVFYQQGSYPSDGDFRAKHMELVLRAWPLLHRQVVGKRLLIDQPQIGLHRDRTGRWHLLSMALGGGAAASEMGNPLGLLSAIRTTRIRNGEIFVVDEFRPDGVRHVRLTALDLTLTSRSRDQSLEFHLSAQVPSPRGTTRLFLSGTASRSAQVAGIQPTFAGSRPAEGFQFDGTAEAVDLDLHQLADFFGPRSGSDRIAGAATISGHIRVAPGVAGYDMVLSEMKGEVAHLALAGQASLSGVFTPQPTFSLTFASSPVSLADLMARVPPQWLHPRLQDIIVERQLQGVIEVVSATVSGTTGPEPRLSLTGQFRVRQGQALVGEDRVRARDLEATVFVEPDRIRVADLTGLYGALRLHGGSAIILLQHNGPWVELDVTGDMDAPDLAALLIRTMTPSAFTAALAALHEVAGTSVLTFHLAGNPTQPGGLKFLGGDFVVRDLRFHTPGLPDRVEGLNGRVRVSRQDGIELDRLLGTIGRTRVEVQGTILTEGSPTLKDVFVLAAVDARDLVKLLPQKMAASMGLEGAIETRLVLSGNPRAPQIRAVLDLKDAAFSTPVLKKSADTPALVEFEGSWSSAGVVTAKRLELSVPALRVAGSGTVRTGPKLAVDASFVTGPVALAQLPLGMRIAGFDGGTLEVSLDVKGQGPDWRRWNLGGWIALTDGRISVKELEAPIRDVYVRVKLERNDAELKQLSFRIGTSDLRASGMIRNWAREPAFDLKAESDKLDIDLVIPKSERSPMRDAIEELADRGRLVATLAIAQGWYKQLTLRDVSCRINIANGSLDIDRIAAMSDGGQVAARLVVALPKRKPADGEVVFRLSNFTYDRLLKLLGDEKRMAEGILSASGTLRMNGRHPKSALNTLDGNVQFLIGEGRIYKGTIVPKIIDILNLPALLRGKVNLAEEGFPFDKISGELTVSQGRFHFENLVLDGPVIKMSAVGDYDLPTNQLDGVVAVSPLGSYSKFLKSIPLFGRLVKGDRKGIDTALFEVKGPFQDPEVHYKPLDSLVTDVKGLTQLAFDILKNTVLLPRDLLSSDHDGIPPSDHERTQPAPREDRGADLPPADSP